MVGIGWQKIEIGIGGVGNWKGTLVKGYGCIGNVNVVVHNKLERAIIHSAWEINVICAQNLDWRSTAEIDWSQKD